MVTIDALEALRYQPRPHYLTGKAEYSFSNGEHKLVSQIIFPSSRDSVSDRNKPSVPHANVGDAYFGIWNAVHIICGQAGVYGTLTNQGSFEAKRPLPPDKPLRLEVGLKETSSTFRHIHAEYTGVYYLEGKELLRISGRGVGRKK